MFVKISMGFLVFTICLLDVKSDAPQKYKAPTYLDLILQNRADNELLRRQGTFSEQMKFISLLKQKVEDMLNNVQDLTNNNLQFLTVEQLTKNEVDHETLGQKLSLVHQSLMQALSAPPEQRPEFRRRLIRNYQDTIDILTHIRNRLVEAPRQKDEWDNEKRLLVSFKEHVITSRKDELNKRAIDLRGKNKNIQEQLLQEALLGDQLYNNLQNHIQYLERRLVEYLLYNQKSYFEEKKKLKQLHNLLEEHRARIEKRRLDERNAQLQAMQMQSMQGSFRQDLRMQRTQVTYRAGFSKNGRG